MCGTTKPLSEFPARKGSADGRRNNCRDCKRAADRARYAGTPREEMQAKRRAYYARNRDRVKARAREYATAHREEKRAYDQRRNRDLAAENRRRVREWRLANPDHMRERARFDARARRARKARLFVEHIAPLVVLERDDGVCGICGCDVNPFDFHVDHIVPLALGGEHSYANAQTAHPLCNLRKGMRLHAAAAA